MRIAIAMRQLERPTGAARVALQQAELLTKAGHRVDLLAETADPKLIQPTGASLHRFPRYVLSGAWARAAFDYRVRRHCQRQKYDLVIGHGDLIDQDLLFLHNCVHLAHERIHGVPISPKNPVGRRHAQMLSKGKFRRLIVNSELMRDDVIQRFKVDPKKIAIMYPGYNSQVFRARQAPAATGRQSLPAPIRERLPKTPYLIGLITSGEYQKRGADLLVSAYLSTAKDFQKNVGLLLVGKSFPKELSAQLSGKSLPFPEHLLALEPSPDVASLYAALDLFVLPARIEEFGLTALEAAVTGVTTLVSDQVGAGAVLPEAYQALTVASGDARSLHTRLEQLWRQGFQVATPELRLELERLRQNASDAQRLKELAQLLQA